MQYNSCPEHPTKGGFQCMLSSMAILLEKRERERERESERAYGCGGGLNKFIHNMLHYRLILHVLVYSLLHNDLCIAVW
jgi:hypothetical protein